MLSCSSTQHFAETAMGREGERVLREGNPTEPGPACATLCALAADGTGAVPMPEAETPGEYEWAKGVGVARSARSRCFRPASRRRLLRAIPPQCSQWFPFLPPMLTTGVPHVELFLNSTFCGDSYGERRRARAERGKSDRAEACVSRSEPGFLYITGTLLTPECAERWGRPALILPLAWCP
jgi:hypothetical protein